MLWAKVSLLSLLWAQEVVFFPDYVIQVYGRKPWIQKLSAALQYPDTVRYLNLKTLPPLDRFAQLKALRLHEVEEIDLPTLVESLSNHCPKLEFLELDACELQDITPLQKLKNLRFLLLPDNEVSQITPLASLKNLEYLDLSGNPLQDISPLQNLANLRFLDLSETSITELSSLTQLTKLEYILLFRCLRINDFSPLLKLPLRTLNVSFCDTLALKTFLINLPTFTKLKELALQGSLTNPTWLSQIAKLPMLEELTIGQNPSIGKHLTTLAPLKNLLYLDIHRTQAADLTWITNHPRLIKLICQYNAISDLSPLLQLKNLRYLYPFGNPIQNWAVLEKIPSLEYVMLSRREVAPDQLQKLRAALPHTRIDVY
ncbi:MAG: leucine-rich repeat domain-containing protein [Bacteroidia bacterium]